MCAHIDFVSLGGGYVMLRNKCRISQHVPPLCISISSTSSIVWFLEDGTMMLLGLPLAICPLASVVANIF